MIKKLEILAILLLITTTTLSSAYTINIIIQGKGISAIVEYCGHIELISKNTTLSLPNTSVTINAYDSIIGYNVSINCKNTSSLTFNTENLKQIIIKSVPIYVWINVKINGNGKVIINFQNGSKEIINQSTKLKVLYGNLLTFKAEGRDGDSFTNWNNNYTYPTMWVIASNNTCIIANFGKVRSSVSSSINFLGIGLLVILGGFYIYIKRKQSPT
ncbi:LPXTG cell wall anchor domain-containing protein [Acidianus sp. HS-5]|uniref:LPXTG cell wall anchor domain-containing protein n=1 Tax=Acidianus sp. HS-5 TaxID=2886040 RepID=UPI001F00BB2D|nr:LPXTG cell wall anchor domain-containing protein [Acidianus sp. HS-5]